MIIGNIGTGKSTYVENVLKQQYDAFVICSDNYEEPTIEAKQLRLEREIKESLVTGKNVVIDGCNISKGARNYFGWLANKYKAQFIAYDFGKGNTQSLLRRLEEDRGEEADVWVTNHKDNQKNYEAPTQQEGFSEIYFNKPKENDEVSFELAV